MFELEQNKNVCPLSCDQHNTVATNSAGVSKRAPVRCFQLEDRLMYSASPVPIEVIDAVSHEIAIDLGDWHGTNKSFTTNLVASELIENSEDVFSIESIVEKDLFQAISLVDLEQLEQMTAIDSTLPIFDLQSQNSAVELIVVDTNVEGYELLVDQIVNGQDDGHFEFIYLSSEQNGLNVIRDHLGGHQKYDALHIISHGSDSIIQFGGQFLSHDNLSQHASTIAAWQHGLTGDSDILFYGCEVAGSNAGQTLLQHIAELTNSDVAGSNDVTGNAQSLGDWELEFATGLIETQQLFLSASPQWHGTLEMIVFQDGTNGYASTQDTYVHEDTPNTQRGSEATAVATDSKHQTLIRFEDVFGNDANEITYGSEINSAQLTLTINSSVVGSTVSIYQVTTDWDETSTWNSIVNGIQLGTESLATEDDTASGSGATITFDVTNSVQNWANGTTNFGWVIVSDSSTQLEIHSVDGGTPGNNPSLQIDFDAATSYQGLLVATSGDNTASGTPGITSWTAGSVLQVSDPNFQLGDDTNGTFSEVIDFTPFTNDTSVKLHGLHFVTQKMTIGNANSFTLQAGDIIFASKTDEVFKSSDGSMLKFLNSDIGVFRPDNPGDFSSGMFFKLLDSPNGNSGEIRSITLVEQDTVVGDVTLNQGDFLFSQRNANTENILWFQTNNVGETTTSGTVVTLITGNDIGFNGAAVQGLELIELATKVGGTTYASGQIIVALQGNETIAGSLVVRAPDAFIINPTQTTAGSGTTVATAEMVFDGSDVNMTSFDEFVFSVALMPSGAIAPTATNLNQVVNYNEDVASVNLANIVVSDPDTGDTLTVTLTLDNTATGSLSALSGNGESYNAGTGTWSITGTASQVNAALASVSFIPQSNNDVDSSIAVQVRDAMGNGPNGSISLVATGVNDPPVLTELAAGILAFVEDGGAVRIGSSIDISDIDSTQMQSIQIRITGGYELGQDELLFTNTANLTGVWNQATGTLTITGSATIAEYENALRQVGFINHSDDPSVSNRTISYRVTDQGGQQSNTINRTMTVTPTNDAPIAQTDTFALNEDTTTNFTTNNLIGNDTDPDGDAIVFVTINQPANGTLTHNGTVVTGMLALPINATLVYTPNQHYNGTDTATYTISDGTVTSTGTVQFVVAPVEDPPVAVDDSINTDNASAFDVANTVLRNDVDPDGSRLRVIISQQPIHGQLTLLNGTLHYIPDPEFAGIDTFTYQLNDGTFTSNTATVTISIDGVSTGGSEPEPDDSGGNEESAEPETPTEENQEESGENEPNSENENDENTESSQGDIVGPNQPVNQDDSETADVITDPAKADASNGQFAGLEEESGTTSRLTTASYQTILVGDQQRTTSSVSTKLVSASLASQSIEVSNLQPLPGNMLAATFLDQLDSVTNELKHDAYVNSGSVATVAGISGVLTVGYVLWLVRSGFVVASFVSTMPAWQMVDPLAVVEYGSSNIDDVDDDALEDMIQVDDNGPLENSAKA